MTLREARIKFSGMISELMVWAKGYGYEVAYDEVTNHAGTGHMPSSLHYSGCAADLLIYKDGMYLEKGDEYRVLGDRWKEMDKDCRWGGDFTSVDLDHYSFSPKEIFGSKA